MTIKTSKVITGCYKAQVGFWTVTVDQNWDCEGNDKRWMLTIDNSEMFRAGKAFDLVSLTDDSLWLSDTKAKALVWAEDTIRDSGEYFQRKYQK